MELQCLTLSELTERIAAKTPTPGGGSAAAAAGALAASVACMVARLTQGKPGYERADARMGEIAARAEELRCSLLENIQKDADCYEGYREALRLPKATEEQKVYRLGTMQKALRDACGVPMEIAHASLEVLGMAKELVSGGLAMAASDAMAAALLARAAAFSATGNVRMNIRDIRDTQFTARMEADCEALEHRGNEDEHEAATLLHARLQSGN